MMRTGITLDTAALIAMERRERRMIKLYAQAHHEHQPMTAPTVVVAEWWRGQSKHMRQRILGGVTVEPLTERLALIAGEALAQVGPGPSIADAIVMASAAQRGDRVLTADFEDLDRLRVCFPSVRFIGCHLELDREPGEQEPVRPSGALDLQTCLRCRPA